MRPQLTPHGLDEYCLGILRADLPTHCRNRQVGGILAATLQPNWEVSDSYISFQWPLEALPQAINGGTCVVEGAYVVHGMEGQEPALIAGERPGADWYTESPERWGRLQRGDESEPVPSERGRWDTFYPAFAAAVRGEGPVPVDPRDAVASLTVIDAIRGS